MEKEKASSLFVNDGSFMERFKKLQEEQQKKGITHVEAQSGINSSELLKQVPGTNKAASDSKDSQKVTPVTSGKLAFSLKQKSKLVAAPVKLGDDDDEDEGDTGDVVCDVPVKRQKLTQHDASAVPSEQWSVAPSPPADPAVKNVADKLASFVAKNGRQFEHITRQRNPGDTPFKFLFDSGCAEYKYYEHRLVEEEKTLTPAVDSQSSRTSESSTSVPRASNNSQSRSNNYQTPASALYGGGNEDRYQVGRSSRDEQSAPSGSDPIAMMEFYMKKAAQEERRRQPKMSKDEMPPPASLHATSKKGHHMGDYIPLEELEKFMATCNDAAAQKSAKEAAERSKIQADNVGHKLLSKMGWKEGEGLGSSKSGRADPVMAGNIKTNHLGVGATAPSEVTSEDDIYEQYKKRMMLGYRHRPNPLGNPRKAYY